MTERATDQPDADLCACLAADLHGAFEGLVLAYQDRLYRFALRLSPSPQDAEEVVQDAFVRAYHALRGYPAERIRSLALRAWLYRITLNLARNRARRRAPVQVPLPMEQREPALPAGWEPRTDARDDPEARLERAQAVAGLAGLLATLPDRYRIALLLRHVEGLGYADAAAVLKKPAGTVKSDVHRGLVLLRAAIANESEAR